MDANAHLGSRYARTSFSCRPVKDSRYVSPRRLRSVRPSILRPRRVSAHSLFVRALQPCTLFTRPRHAHPVEVNRPRRAIERSRRSASRPAAVCETKDASLRSVQPIPDTSTHANRSTSRRGSSPTDQPLPAHFGFGRFHAAYGMDSGRPVLDGTCDPASVPPRTQCPSR